MFYRQINNCSAILAIAIALTLVAGVSRSESPKTIRYNRDVRPILAENCFACHGFDAASRAAGLRLDTSEGAFAELDSGETAIVPGNVEKSQLLSRIESSDHGLVMPPPESKKQLTASQKRMLRSWIEQGAVYEKHWAFEPPSAEAPPVVDSSVSNPIDSFIVEKLKASGLRLSAPAVPEVQLRRLYLDTIGIPPTPEQIDQFLVHCQVDADGAYRQAVDRLLASPGYGERWGRWWLDQARYADSNGYSIDAPRQIWPYRDWVIDALNSDLSFDQFTIEQLAGDLLPNPTEAQIIATGFHRNTQINQEGGIDPEQFRIDSVFDRVATTGTVWLGLTIGCAQCHNHKFDPIEQREYYQLFAFFNNQDEPTRPVYPADLNVKELRERRKTLNSEVASYLAPRHPQIQQWVGELSEARIKELGKDIQNAIKASDRNTAQWRLLYAVELGKSDAEFQKLSRQLQEVDTALEPKVTTMVLHELPKPRKTTVYIKGDFTRPAEIVQCGTPSALPGQLVSNDSRRLTRLDLARWLVHRSNPLTPRVIANRIWHQYFGRGLVETENDFGLQGTPPSHPELLDWLATELVAHDWSLKHLQRTILTSNVYRQSSHETAEHIERDRDNLLLSRQRRLRLDGELVRDVGLAASGLLSKKMFGPPVFPPIPDGVMTQGQVKREWKASVGEDRYRRGIYTFLYRATPPPSLNVFDVPDGFSACTRRIRSNTPLQALTLMNDEGFIEFAVELKAVIEREGLTNAFRRCTGRSPEENEVEILSELDSLNAARAILNLDETITRE